MTLEEEMALAVLRGEDGAAYMLADRLIERLQTNYKEQEVRRALRRRTSGMVDGYAVYGWPEFRALAARLGIAWEVRTRKLTLTFEEGEPVGILHEYIGGDEGSAA